jgi:putative transposase
MDQSTHDVRRTQWIEIISACQARPEGTTVKQWLLDNGIKDKAYFYWLRKFRKEAYEKMGNSNAGLLPAATSSPDFVELKMPACNERSGQTFSFRPDAVIQHGDYLIALSNGTSENLVRTIMEGLKNAR